MAPAPTAKAQENLITPKTGVQEDYDKFKDKTFVSVGPQYLTLASSSKAGRAWFSLMFSFEGQVAQSEPLGYTFGLGVIAAEQPLGSDRRLIILADGKRVFDDEASLLDTRNTALPQKSGFGLLYEANVISAPKGKLNLVREPLQRKVYDF